MPELQLRTADGLALGAVFYEAQRPRTPRRVAVLHGGAGIGALRYRRFAQFLAEWGLPILTYDFRGVGLSRPTHLRGFEATTADWVEHDAAAAINWLRDRFPDDELIGISHSIGALALAGAPNANRQDRLFFIAPHTGYLGDYRLAYRLPMTLLWHGLMPALTRLVGYFPGQRLRLCDDLPLGVALEWARRRMPDLRASGLRPERSQRLLDLASKLDRPAIAITITDDAFATVSGAKHLLSYFPALRPEQIVVAPADVGMQRLGHFGFFRRAPGAALWPRLLALIGTS